MPGLTSSQEKHHTLRDTQLHTSTSLHPLSSDHTQFHTHTLTHSTPSHLRGVILETDDSSLDHLVVEIIPLTSPLPHPSEHRAPSVSVGHVVDQLHDHHCLTHTSTAKQTCVGVYAWE